MRSRRSAAGLLPPQASFGTIDASVLGAVGSHLFPSRTQQLSPPAPKILGTSVPGKIGQGRDLKRLRRASVEVVLLFRKDLGSSAIRPRPSPCAAGVSVARLSLLRRGVRRAAELVEVMAGIGTVGDRLRNSSAISRSIRTCQTGQRSRARRSDTGRARGSRRGSAPTCATPPGGADARPRARQRAVPRRPGSRVVRL